MDFDKMLITVLIYLASFETFDSLDTTQYLG